MPMIASTEEFHLSIRVADLDVSTAFYAAFLGTAPKDRTPRFSTFVVPDLRMNLVLLVNDSGRPLDTYSPYHVGLGVRDKAAVVESYLRAKASGAHIVKPPADNVARHPIARVVADRPHRLRRRGLRPLDARGTGGHAGRPGAHVPRAWHGAMIRPGNGAA